MPRGEFTLWTMGNGKTIAVAVMSDSHLRFSIAKIKRENWRMNWLHPLQMELFKRRMKEAAENEVDDSGPTRQSI